MGEHKWQNQKKSLISISMIYKTTRTFFCSIAFFCSTFVCSSAFSRSLRARSFSWNFLDCSLILISYTIKLSRFFCCRSIVCSNLACSCKKQTKTWFQNNNPYRTILKAADSSSWNWYKRRVTVRFVLKTNKTGNRTKVDLSASLLAPGLLSLAPGDFGSQFNATSFWCSWRTRSRRSDFQIESWTQQTNEIWPRRRRLLCWKRASWIFSETPSCL